MIRLKVRTHGHVDTVTRVYDEIRLVVESVESAGVERAQAILVAHREVFAYIGTHEPTGQRFAVWRSNDEEAA